MYQQNETISRLEEVLVKMEEVIFKEENMIPMLAEVMAQDEWKLVAEESGEIGFIINIGQ